jgi:hypothetical protein
MDKAEQLPIEERVVTEPLPADSSVTSRVRSL